MLAPLFARAVIKVAAAAAEVEAVGAVDGDGDDGDDVDGKQLDRLWRWTGLLTAARMGVSRALRRFRAPDTTLILTKKTRIGSWRKYLWRHFFFFGPRKKKTIIGSCKNLWRHFFFCHASAARVTRPAF